MSHGDKKKSNQRDQISTDRKKKKSCTMHGKENGDYIPAG
jgi:hypothetical protein